MCARQSLTSARIIMCSRPPQPVHTDLHPLVERVASLLGTYSGAGEGIYSTIPSFKYWDETRFEAVPSKPVIQYQQKSYALTEDGQPNYNKSMHLESGFLTLLPSSDATTINAQLVIAHNSGVSEVAEGEVRLQGSALQLAVTSRAVGLTSTAKQVTQLQRRYALTGNRLEVMLMMEAVAQPLQQHLHAVLARKESVV